MSQKFDSIIIENFNGGEVLSIEPDLLASNQLQKAINVRFSKAGGVTNRPGYEEKALAGVVDTSKIQGAFATASEVFFVANGNLYVTLEDFSDAFIIKSGLSATATCRFLEYTGNVYMFNGVDELQWIKIATSLTPLVAGVSSSLSLQAGQGWRMPNTGNIYVVSSSGSDEILVTAKTNDVLTIAAATVNYSCAAGYKAYYVESIPEAVAPKFSCGVEFQNVFLAAIPTGKPGENYQGNTLFYSAGGTGVAPESFHDFVSAPAGFIPCGDGGDITALGKTKTYAVLTKKNSCFVISGFDPTGGFPLVEPVTTAYGAAGPECMALVGDQMILFTGKELKQFGEQVGLNNMVPSINARFDDKIFTYLKELDEDQSDAVMSFNPAQKLLKVWVNDGGGRTCVVYDDKIDAFSRDYNKPASVVFVYKDETFWGSQVEAKIFQDEIGFDDNGLAILSQIITAEFSAGNPRLSKYFKTLYISGKLGEGTKVNVKIYFDSVVVQEFSLTAALLVDSVNGTPIGRNRIGGTVIGSSAMGTLAYKFVIEKLLKKRRNVGKMYIEFSSDGIGQVFEISTCQIEGNLSKKFDKFIRT